MNSASDNDGSKKGDQVLRRPLKTLPDPKKTIRGDKQKEKDERRVSVGRPASPLPSARGGRPFHASKP